MVPDREFVLVATETVGGLLPDQVLVVAPAECVCGASSRNHAENRSQRRHVLVHNETLSSSDSDSCATSSQSAVDGRSSLQFQWFPPWGVSIVRGEDVDRLSRDR